MPEFAASAARLAGRAGAVFGWRPYEFWAATPAELGALVAAMRGDGDGLEAADVKALRRMLRAGEERDG